MYEVLKRAALVLLRVPPEPASPAGAPSSLRVFRAAPNFYRLRLVQWGVRQVLGLIGLVGAIVAMRAGFQSDWLERRDDLRGLMWLLGSLEVLGVLGFVVQLPFSYLLTRLDFELRWYLVTDRSLRIRSGVWRVDELTMTFANIQELTIHQGPLQRLLGIADLKVRSAGGGAAGNEGGEVRESHVAYFHGVDNAPEIRDLILAHLRRQRDTGLGDPDAPEHLEADVARRMPDGSGTGPEGEDCLLSGAKEVLLEVRALRRVVDEARRPGQFPPGGLPGRSGSGTSPGGGPPRHAG